MQAVLAVTRPRNNHLIDFDRHRITAYVQGGKHLADGWLDVKRAGLAVNRHSYQWMISYPRRPVLTVG